MLPDRAAALQELAPANGLPLVVGGHKDGVAVMLVTFVTR